MDSSRSSNNDEFKLKSENFLYIGRYAMGKNIVNSYNFVSLIIAILYFPMLFLTYWISGLVASIYFKPIAVIVMYSPFLGILFGIIGIIKCENHKHSKFVSFLSILMNIGVIVIVIILFYRPDFTGYGSDYERGN